MIEDLNPFIESKRVSYEDRLRDGVTADELTSHKHFLKKAIPLRKALEQMQRDGDHGIVFDADDEKQFADFVRLLGRKMVSVALVKVDTSKADDEREIMLRMMKGS